MMHSFDGGDVPCPSEDAHLPGCGKHYGDDDDDDDSDDEMSDDSDDEMTDDSDGNEKGGCSQSILALETLTLVRCHFHQSSHKLIIWTNPQNYHPC